MTKVFRFGRVKPMLGGKLPLRLFNERKRTSSEEMLKIEGGTVPERLVRPK